VKRACSRVRLQIRAVFSAWGLQVADRGSCRQVGGAPLPGGKGGFAQSSTVWKGSNQCTVKGLGPRRRLGSSLPRPPGPSYASRLEIAGAAARAAGALKNGASASKPIRCVSLVHTPSRPWVGRNSSGCRAQGTERMAAMPAQRLPVCSTGSTARHRTTGTAGLERSRPGFGCSLSEGAAAGAKEDVGAWTTPRQDDRAWIEAEGVKSPSTEELLG